MAKKSPLRQLAKEFYDGKIDRAYYVKQRSYLLDSIVSGNGAGLDSPDATVPGTFLAPKSGQLDSTDLSNALAQRQIPPAPDFGDFGGGSGDNYDTVPTADMFKQTSPGRREQDRQMAYAGEPGSPGTSLVDIGQPESKGEPAGRPWSRIAMWALGVFVLVVIILRAL